MKPMTSTRVRLSTAVAGLAAALLAAAAAPLTLAPGAGAGAAPVEAGAGMRGYHVYDLSGGASGFQRMVATGVSDAGTVSGYVIQADSSISPFFWEPGAPWQYLDQGGAQSAWAEAISPTGVIAGYTYEPGDDDVVGHIVRWQKAPDADFYGAVDRLEPLRQSAGGGLGTDVLAVNAAGQILLGGARNAVIDPAGGATELVATIPQGADNPRLAVVDVNVHGQVAGMLGYDPDQVGGPLDDTDHPAIWDGSQPTELPMPPGSTEAWARAINDDGHVATGISTAGAAWLWRGGSYTYLGDFEPMAMNDSDQVVGVGPHGAMLWDGQDLVDLNALVDPDAGWRLDDAVAINENGQIAGTGMHDGRQVAFLLDPIVPVVFVPGAAASSLVVGDDPAAPVGTEIWLGCGEDRIMLSLNPADFHPDDVYARDALRYMTCGPLDGHIVPDLDAYGTLLSRLASQGGFREYRVDGHPERRTTDGCDLSQKDQRPALFVFAYDWRRSNVESAAQLTDYLGCVRRFYPGGKINIVTHSMGSLVARRYLLDHPEQHAGIGRVITIGAPWLGAPKLVNALETGEFAPFPVIIASSTIKHIIPWFPATHQLMSAAWYHQVSGPVFREDGWDINGNGVSHEAYDYAEMAELLDSQTPGHFPAQTATEFQGYRTAAGGQVDWRDDATGIEYFHVVGLQSGAATIGQVVASSTPVCVIGDTWFCTVKDHIEKDFVVGDGTVPLVSAIRAGNGMDLNAPGATVLTVTSSKSSQDHDAEHTGLTANESVVTTIIGLLQGGELDRGGDAGLAARTTAAGQFDNTPAGAPIATDLDVGTAAAEAAGDAAAATPMRYLSVLDAADIAVADGHGATTAPIEGTDVRLTVPGVTQTSAGDQAADIVLPQSPTETYTVSFTTTGDPLRIELREGLQHTPTKAVRWSDVDAPVGVAASLTVSANGTNTVRYDADGDGTPETVVAPSVTLTGPDAADVDAPQVTITANDAGGETRYAVSATDGGSGVARVLWSTDGQRFRPYTGPLALDVTVTPKLFAFAEDRAGNRSSMVDVALAAVASTPLTTATLTPQPNAAGWNTGTVSVSLDAVAASGSTIDHLTYATAGAQQIGPTTVAGSSTSFTVDAVGRTTITFSAAAADGTVEPQRTVTVGIDAAAPTVTVRTPAAGATVESLATIAGSAGDDASGVAAVELSLANDQGEHWDGTAWSASPAWLSTQGSTGWSLSTGLPSGDQLPQGAYTLRARATDNAGRTTTTSALPLTVADVAGREVFELPSPAVPFNHTSATAINDRGIAAGAAGVDGVSPISWRRGVATVFARPDGFTTASIRAIDTAGDAVGDGGTGSGTSALAWQPDGDVEVLAPLAGAQLSAADDINDAGVIVGRSGDRAVRWDGGVVSPLPSFVAGGRGEARGINDAGVIVGSSSLDSGDPRAVLWADGQVRNLGTLGGTTSDAFAVSDRDDVVGSADDAAGARHAFLYRDGEMRDISAGLGAASSKAVAINDAGVAVGEFTDRGGRTFAFVWTEETGAVDLNAWLPAGSGWVLTRANDVNEFGQITGFGTYHGQPRAFLLGTAHAPFAEDASATTEAGHPVAIRLDGWDPDVIAPLTASIVAGPAHGELSPLDGDTVTYTPAPGFHGEDAFTFRVNDGRFDSAPARVTLAITGDPPTTTPTDDTTTTPPTTAPTPTTVPTDDTTTTTVPPGADTSAPGEPANRTDPTTVAPDPTAPPPSVSISQPTAIEPGTDAPTPPSIPAGGLPTTGADTGTMQRIAVLALCAGAVLVALRRVRRRAP